MNEPTDMNDVIEESLNDAVSADHVDNTPAPDVDASADTSTDATDTLTEDTTVEGSTDQVVAGGAAQAAAGDTPNASAEDAFAKKFGLQSQSVTGRENRIPYSRVKKIVEKNERDVVARVSKEVEAKFQPKVLEFETKVKDYEGRLEKVAQFEHVLENDPRQFLSMLSQVPAYKEFFEFVTRAAQGAEQSGVQEQPDLTSGMPQPNDKLADGSMVYNMEGLQKLLDWQSKQVEDRITKGYETKLNEFQKRVRPIEEQWNAQQHMAKIVPVVEKQIADARTWPQFNENEPAIVAALKADQNLSLEGAYRMVVFPRLVSDRNKLRTEIIAEMKTKPVASSVSTSATRPGTSAQAGPRSLEDIIADAAASLK